MMGEPGSNPDQNNPRDRGLRNGRQHILVCNDDDDDDDMNKMKIKIIMTMLMKTWLAFTFAVHGIAEGTCKESEKDKCDECDHCKSEKKEKCSEYYRCDNNSRGHSLVQIYPGGRGGHSPPLQHNSYHKTF